MLSKQFMEHHRIEEPAMRHALIPIHLLQEARAAARPPVAERQVPDAAPEVPAEVQPEPRRRLAVLARRARALVVRTT
jgi:hypothetical protein